MLTSLPNRSLPKVAVMSFALLSLASMPLLAQSRTDMPAQQGSGDIHHNMTPEQMQQHHQSMLEQMRQMTTHMESMTPEMIAQMTPAQQQQHHQQMMAQMKEMMGQMEQWGQMMQGNHSMAGDTPHQMEEHQSHPAPSGDHHPAGHH